MKFLIVFLTLMAAAICVPATHAQYYNIAGNCNHCTCGSHSCYGKPHCAPPPSHAVPFGQRYQCAFQTQISNGIQSQLMFYNYDFAWNGTGNQLSALGYRHLANMMRLTEIAPGHPMNFTVQATGDPAADENRRQAVHRAMVAAGLPVVMDQIGVAYPSVRGLTGTEAEQIYSDFLDPSRYRIFKDDTGIESAFLGSGN